MTTLVLGVGNWLMGDEGVGVHAVRQYSRQPLPPDVFALDGGTGGFHLLSYLQDFPHVIMIDATTDGQPDGTVCVLRPRYASDYPRALSAHDIGLRDLIESAALLGPLPEVDLITISVSEIRSMVTDLSPAVDAAIPAVLARVSELVWRNATVPHA